MKIPYFSIYDIKAEIHGSLFSAPTPGAAERALHDSVNTPDTPHNKHPKDYRLMQIGEFDDTSGLFEPFDVPQFVCEANQLVDV